MLGVLGVLEDGVGGGVGDGRCRVFVDNEVCELSRERGERAGRGGGVLALPGRERRGMEMPLTSNAGVGCGGVVV